MYQSNPLGVELFSYVNNFVGFMIHNLRTELLASTVKLHISSFDLFSRKQPWFWSEKIMGTQHAPKLQLSVRMKSRTYLVKTCLQCLTLTSNLKEGTYPLQSTTSCLDTRKSSILHNTQKKAHGQTGR